MSDVVLSMCDLTGKFVEPWVQYGYTAILVDPQHETGVSKEGRLIRVGHIINHQETWGIIKSHIHRLAFVAGFPPCTDVAVSGSRWFEDKRKADPFFQAKAALVAEQCRTVGQLSGAPWFFENPVSVFSSIFGKPTHTFHPWQFNALCPDDNYTKHTCLWTGNGFRMPSFRVDPYLPPPDDRIHKCAPGPDRANIRSATPRGFSLAVFLEHGQL